MRGGFERAQLALRPFMPREVVLRTAGEHPVRNAQDVVRQVCVHAASQLFAPCGTRAVRHQGCERNRYDRRAEHRAQQRTRPRREHAHPHHNECREHPRDDRREDRAKVQVLHVPDVFGQQTEHVAQAMPSPEEDRVPFERTPQFQPEGGRHAQNPVVADQALEVLEHRLAHAKQANEHERKVQQQDGGGQKRRAADKVA